MVKRSIDQKLRLLNFDVRHGKIFSGAVVNNRRNQVALKEEKVPIISGKKKASVRMETDAVSATKPTDPSRQETLHLRALQFQLGHNIIDPSLLDNVQSWTISSSTFVK